MSDEAWYEDPTPFADAIAQPVSEPVRPQLEAIDGGGERDDDAPAGVDGFRLSDAGNARRLLKLHGDDLRHVHRWSKWLVWDGRRWRLDETGEPTRRMLDMTQRLVDDANRLLDGKERKRLIKHAVTSERAARVTGTLQLAAAIPPVPVHHDALDVDPFLLNVTNGTIDLRTGVLRPHAREDLITKLAPVTYDPDARAPQFEKFLAQVLPDESTRKFVVGLLGYTLTGDTSEQLLPILYGAGSNGKTTLLETIRALLGDYGQQAPAETFLERRDSIPNDVARLHGARFVAATETGEGRRLNEVLVKRLTGGDTIAARFMRSEWFEFKPQFKAWLATNHRPEVRGSDDAIWRRLRLVPFNVRITDDQRDPKLPDKLRAELPGILNLAVDACLAWQLEGLPTATAVTDATHAYRTDSDLIGRFIEDCCVLGDTVKAKSGDLYNRLDYWCKANGEQAPSAKGFGLRLRDRGFTQTRTSGARWWLGVGIRDESSDA